MGPGSRRAKGARSARNRQPPDGPKGNRSPRKVHINYKHLTPLSKLFQFSLLPGVPVFSGNDPRPPPSFCGHREHAMNRSSVGRPPSILLKNPLQGQFHPRWRYLEHGSERSPRGVLQQNRGRTAYFAQHAVAGPNQSSQSFLFRRSGT